MLCEHVLYKTGDADAPSSIKDINGDVALGMCRKCGRAEAELDDATYVEGLKDEIHRLGKKYSHMLEMMDRIRTPVPSFNVMAANGQWKQIVQSFQQIARDAINGVGYGQNPNA